MTERLVKLFSENTGIILVTGSTGSGKSTTLHTNDSFGAITRLVGLGVDPNMITSSLIAVVSQRLAR
ncbi:MAG: Flp pilus assembly complex ATPase component TadA, partial [Deltaproteobacteria bacterium]|nr:Flp pilus assembly complex ATPase component TadA [Deltaproteobacteria bacterium]